MPKNSLSDQAVGFILKVEAKAALDDLQKAEKFYTKLERRVRSAGAAFKDSTKDIIDSVNEFTDTSKSLIALLGEILEATGKTSRAQVDDEKKYTQKFTQELKKRGDSYKEFVDTVSSLYKKMKDDVGDDFIRGMTGANKPTTKAGVSEDALKNAKTQSDKIGKLSDSIEELGKDVGNQKQDLLNTTQNIATKAPEAKIDKETFKELRQTAAKDPTQAVNQATSKSDSLDIKTIKDLEDALIKVRFLESMGDDVKAIKKIIEKQADDKGITVERPFSLNKEHFKPENRDRMLRSLEEKFVNQVRSSRDKQKGADAAGATPKDAKVNINTILSAMGFGRFNKFVSLGTQVFKKMSASHAAMGSAGGGGTGVPTGGGGAGGGAFGNVGAIKGVLTLAAIAATTVAILKAVSAVNEFNNDLLNLKRTAIATTAEMKAIGDQALDIGFQSGIATDKIIEVAAALRSKGGFKKIDGDFKQITETAAKLAEVVDMSGAEIVDMLADVSMGMKVGKKNAIDFGASMVRVAKMGGIAFEALRDAVLGVREAMRRLDAQLSDKQKLNITKATAVYAQQLAKNYGDASTAAQDFNDASRIGTDELSKQLLLLQQGGFNMSMGEAMKMAKQDTHEYEKRMIISSQRIKKSFDDTGRDITLLGDTFGDVTKIIDRAQINVEEFDKAMQDASKTGTMEEVNSEWKGMLSSLSRLFERTEEILKALTVNLVKPFIDPVISAVENMIGVFDAIPGPLKTFWMWGMKIGAGLQPLAIVLKLISGLFWIVKKSVEVTFQPFTAFYNALSKSEAFNAFTESITGVFTALGDLKDTVAAFFNGDYVKADAMADKFSAGFQKVMEDIPAQLTKVFEALPEVITEAMNTLTGKDSNAHSLAGKVGIAIAKGFLAFVKQMPKLLISVLEVIPKTLFGSFTNLLPKFGLDFKTKIVDAMKELPMLLFDAVKTAVVKTLGFILKVLYDNPVMKTISGIGNLIDGAITPKKDLFPDFNKKVIDFLDVDKALGRKPEPVKTAQIGQQIVNGTAGGDDGLLNENQKQSGLLQDIANALSNLNKGPDARTSYNNTTNIINRNAPNRNLVDEIVSGGR